MENMKNHRILSMLLVLTMLVFSMIMPVAGVSAAEKDTLIVGVGSEFSQLVPLSSNTAVSNRDGIAIFAMYDPLIWRDQITGELQPCIAESWEMSDDSLECTLYLRHDVTFHNGTPMTAEDVAWTLNLLPDCPNVSTQNYPGFNHAEAVDDYTVKIYMDAPFAALMPGLAAYHIVPLSKAYFDEVGWEGYQAAPIGTGPYKFVSRSIGANLKMEAYDGYWGDKAKIKNFTLRILSDTNSQMLSLEVGEIDAMYNSSIQNVTRLDTSKGDLTWTYSPAMITSVLMFNTNKGNIMLDENLRKAILSSISYDGINQAINLGYTVRATSMLPPGTNDRPADGTYSDPLPQDIDAAKAYLAASDYDGSTLRMICISGSKEANILTIILGDLQAIGINAEVIPVDGATYMTYAMSGEYEFSIYNIMPSLFDANLLMQMYDPKSSLTANSAIPDKTTLEDLGQQTITETDHEKRQALFAQMMDIINVHAYNGYLYYDVMTMAYDSALQNVVAIPSSNYRVSNWSW